MSHHPAIRAAARQANSLRANSLQANSVLAKGRLVVMASIVALVAASFDTRAALAAPAAARQMTSASEDIAFSARKRGRSHRGNNAAGLAMMGLMIGAVGGVIAAQQRRDAYEDAYNARYRAYNGYYGGSYGGYAPGPAYHHHHRAAPVIVPQYRHRGHGGPGGHGPDGYAGPVKRAY